MGVRSLTTFLSNGQEYYFTPHVLQNCNLVIDGNNLAAYIYRNFTKRDSAFGGDYDEYYVLVKSFFATLKNCNIHPIVIMDGGREGRKLQTALKRRMEHLKTVILYFQNNFSDTKMFPAFKTDVFFKAVQSSNVILIKTEFEADNEIADIARQLSCPVLSFDSDFFIYGVEYIPLNLFDMESCLRKKISSGKGIDCWLYNVNNFLHQFPGLELHHLPYLAVFLGNDYNPRSTFLNLYKRLQLIKNEASSIDGEKLVHGIINWLRQEKETTILTKLKTVFKKSEYAVICEYINDAKKNYFEATGCNATKDSKQLRIIPNITNLPINCEIRKLLQDCILSISVLDFLTLHLYFPACLIEDVRMPSVHLISETLISVIYVLLCSDADVFPREFKVHLRKDKHMMFKTIAPAQLPLGVSLTSLRLSPVLVRKTFLFDVMEFEEQDVNCIENVHEDCQLFIISFLKWSKEKSIKAHHMHALLLSYLYFQGHYRVGLCNSSVPSKPVLEFLKTFVNLKKTAEHARRNYVTSVVHVYNSFQSLLYHISQLNILLDYPVKPCRIIFSFSGTFTYNMYHILANQKQVMTHIGGLLNSVPEILKIYENLYEVLSRYFQEVERNDRKRKNKLKKKKYFGNVADYRNNDTDEYFENSDDAYYDDCLDDCYDECYDVYYDRYFKDNEGEKQKEPKKRRKKKKQKKKVESEEDMDDFENESEDDNNYCPDLSNKYAILSV